MQNSLLTPAQITDSLNWRYATKSYDKTKKLTFEQVNLVRESLRLAASSYGLQAWKFIQIDTPETREKIKSLGWGQGQYTDASHLFALCTYTNPVENADKIVDEYVQDIIAQRGDSEESLAGYKGMMLNAVKNGNTSGNSDKTVAWLDHQVYIALGQAMTVCALAGIDTSPMEGFDVNGVNELLGLSELGLQVKVFLAVGFRSEEDKYSLSKKVRYGQDKLFITK